MCCSLDKLEVEDGLPPDDTEAVATRWGGHAALEHMLKVVQPPLQQRPPMPVRGAAGHKLEMAMDRTWDQARFVVHGFGKSQGGESWVGKLTPSALESTVAWINLPAERRERTSTPWAKVQGGLWFACIRSGDRPERIGVAVWCLALVCGDM